jgi:hypothetical protein
MAEDGVQQQHAASPASLGGLPLDLLAGVALLGGFRLAELSPVACVCVRMRDAAAVAAARHTAVSLAGPYDADDAVPLLGKLPSLTALDLAGALPAGCASACLQTLFGAAGAGAARADFCSSLTCLRASGVQDEEVIERSASACARLQALGLRSSSVGDQTLSSIAGACPGLRAIDLSNTPTGDYGVSMLLLQCDNLRQLALRACPISDAALASIALGGSNLETLDVGWCRQLTDEGLENMTAPSALPSLRSLNLTKCNLLSFKAVCSVARLQTLEHLYAAGLCKAAHGEEVRAFAMLGQLSSLAVLDVSVPVPPWTVGDRAIGALCASSAPAAPLSHLRVVACHVTAASCRLLAQKYGASLQSLDLTGAVVDDRGLAALAACCRQLVVLRVNSCAHITDTGIGHLLTTRPPPSPAGAPPVSLLPVLACALSFAHAECASVG